MAAIRDSGGDGGAKRGSRDAASLTSHADTEVMMMRMMAFKTPASTGADGLGSAGHGPDGTAMMMMPMVAVPRHGLRGRRVRLMCGLITILGDGRRGQGMKRVDGPTTARFLLMTGMTTLMIAVNTLACGSGPGLSRHGEGNVVA